MFCSKCGTSNDEGALYCGNCGATLDADEQSAAELAEPAVAAAETAVDAGTEVIEAGVPIVPAPEEGVPAAPPRAETARLASPELEMPQPAPVPAPAVTPRRLSPESAFLVEFLAGIFGLLGIGYLAAGKTNDGVVRLVVWLVYTVLAWLTISLLAAIVVGLVCIPFQLILQILVPLWSANKLKRQLIAEG
ncbi:MAG TPA: zinc-ribbon domain-containing protein [Anaerolineae bacterium]|nr:zinc-ribbon domain-containing protein [Anaerolineae bacterium]